jgi:type I restriction enzyme M protein
MRILVHYQAYGDSTKVSQLVAEHSGRIREQINQRELEEVQRLEAEYKEYNDKLAKADTEISELQPEMSREQRQTEKAKIQNKISKLESQRQKLGTKVVERDERISDARRSSDEDRKALSEAGQELGALYGNPEAFLKHAHVVPMDEILDNEFNLNIPRYVDTFEPEPKIELKDALSAVTIADRNLARAEAEILELLREAGYAE